MLFGLRGIVTLDSTIPQVLADALRELTPQLRAIATARVPDGWLAAGAIRNRVWNRVLGDRGMPETDWDVAFAGDLDAREVEGRLSEQLSGPWEASNQHSYGYPSAAQGIASWPETATAIGARLRGDDIELLAPWGLEDLVRGRLRRSPGFTDEQAFLDRERRKSWLTRWPGLVRAEWRDGIPDFTTMTVRVP